MTRPAGIRRRPQINVFFGREMACVYLWDYLAGKWPVFICGMTRPEGVQRRPQIMCFLAVKWLVFICGMTRPAGVRRRPQIIWFFLGREMACIYLWNDSYGGGSAMTSNNVLLAVKWPVFYLRDFVRLFGREMAFIYLWNDSSGGVSATTSNNVFLAMKWLVSYLSDYLAVKWLVFICGIIWP